MKELLAMLQYTPANTKTLAIAKGLYFLPATLKETHKRNKQTYIWQKHL